MRAGTVDVDLGEHRKCHGIFGLAEWFDLLGVARLLRAELVAGKAEHRKAARPQLLLQRLQALVLRREPAGARGIDDQEHLPLEPPKRDVFACERLRRKIINAWHRVLFVGAPVCQPAGSIAADGVPPASIASPAARQRSSRKRPESI